MATSLYAALCALLFIALSVNIIRIRRKEFIALYDGGQTHLKRAIRAHGNFAEFTPLFLILLFICEYNGLAPIFIHLLGIIFFIGRLFHGYSMTIAEKYDAQEKLTSFPRFRFLGMILTFMALFLVSLLLMAQFFFPYL